MRALRKTIFNEGQRTEGFFQHPGASKASKIIVDLRSEHDLKVVVTYGDSSTAIQVIRLTHRPAGFNGRRWYFVSEKGERAETLFLVDGRFRTRTEARLTYRSQSMGELDRVLERRQKLEARLKGTRAQGPARGRRRKQAEQKLAEIQRAVDAIGTGIVVREQDRRARARERRHKSLERLEAARTAMTQRKDMQPEWVITTFGTLVDDLKAGTGSPSPAPSPIPPRTTSSNTDSQVDIGILQRLGLCRLAKCWAISSGGLKRGFPNQEGDSSSLSTCATVEVHVRYFWSAIPDGTPHTYSP